MRSRLSRTILTLLLALLLGGQWVVLQSVAWVGMFLDFARTESIGTALGKTLDGRHPCRLCEYVRKGSAEERRQEASGLRVKLEPAVRCVPIASILPPHLEPLAARPASAARSRTEPPPTPPPRLA